MAKLVTPVSGARVAGILKEAICYQIGSGAAIQVWCDPWLLFPSPHAPVPRTNSTIMDEEVMVDSLTLPFSNSWNANLIRSLFCDEDAEAILSFHAPRANHLDTLIWTASSNGKFSLKSAYSLLASHRNQSYSTFIDVDWKRLWRAPLQDRLKLLLWKIAWNSLPCMSNIERSLHRSLDDNICGFCHHEGESLVHLFFECPIAQIAWKEAP